MFSGRFIMTFSKLRVFSRLLDCSVSSLKYCADTSANRILRQPFFTSASFASSRFTLHRNCSSASNTESPFSNVNIEAVAMGDEELMKKLKVIILEAEVMRQEGLRVPSSIDDEKWKELLHATSRSHRIKLLAFWFTNERKKIKDKMKKEESRLRREADRDQIQLKKETDHIYYGLGGCNMLMRVYDSSIDAFNNYKLIQAMMFGQNLIFDCSYDEHMNAKESTLCATQLKILFSENRIRDEPFNIHFCNVNKDGLVFRRFQKLVPTLYEPVFPINITDKSYLELFPKEKLVYLTPHCREQLRRFDSDDIYIIGAIVDKSKGDPISLGKAKALNLRMAALPLDKYLDWGLGSKSLALNQVLLILHELKATGDWSKALQHVPKRKIKSENFLEKHEKNNFKKERIRYSLRDVCSAD